jgi:hypothetical protein
MSLRKHVIRLAASLPEGSDDRRALLAALSENTKSAGSSDIEVKRDRNTVTYTLNTGMNEKSVFFLKSAADDLITFVKRDIGDLPTVRFPNYASDVIVKAVSGKIVLEAYVELRGSRSTRQVDQDLMMENYREYNKDLPAWARGPL